MTQFSVSPNKAHYKNDTSGKRKSAAAEFLSGNTAKSQMVTPLVTIWTFLIARPNSDLPP